jgi:UTP--glucose-1-phosphate uridylyltransferase
MTLEQALAALPEELRKRLSQRGFDPKRLATWAADIHRGQDQRNRLGGAVRPVGESLIATAPTPEDPRWSELQGLGAAALKRGELAVCVLAGGMATRMGGVVKALVEVTGRQTFLDLRVAEHRRLEADHGRPVPLWLMTSEATDGPIREALGDLRDDNRIATFEQLVSLRLTPEGGLWVDETGQPSVYATGHGDLPSALQASGLIDRFIGAGGRYLWISNLDNLGASVDLAILGQHIDSAAALTVELVDKYAGDRGGGPVLHDGKPIIAEDFRVPLDFDVDQVPVFNTNTFLTSAHELAKLDMEWTYVEVRKEVAGSPAVQFERLLGEMTETLVPRFLRVPRAGPETRFMPMKSRQDLEQSRALIEQIAQARVIDPD